MAMALGGSFFGLSIIFPEDTASLVFGVPSRDFGPIFGDMNPPFGPVPPFSGAPIVPSFNTLASPPSGFGPQAAPLATPAPGETVRAFDGDAIHLLGVADGADTIL